MHPKELFERATEAARKAIEIEIVVNGPEDPYAFDCGFAWVVVKPATGPFVSWCKKQKKEADLADAFKYGSKHYGGGWEFWKPGDFNGQSIRIHLAGAMAFCKVLQEAGLYAETGSRLD